MKTWQLPVDKKRQQTTQASSKTDENLKHTVSTACRPRVFQIALFKGFPNIPHIPLPPEHSVGRNEATMAPNPENPESWHIQYRPRETCFPWPQAAKKKIRVRNISALDHALEEEEGEVGSLLLWLSAVLVHPSGQGLGLAGHQFANPVRREEKPVAAHPALAAATAADAAAAAEGWCTTAATAHIAAGTALEALMLGGPEQAQMWRLRPAGWGLGAGMPSWRASMRQHKRWGDKQWHRSRLPAQVTGINTDCDQPRVLLRAHYPLGSSTSPLSTHTL